MIYFIDFINKVSPICRELHSFRQILTNQTTLHYYQIFRQLDTTMKGYISTRNLTQTLKLDQELAKIIMRQFSKVVGTLKLMEFKQLLDIGDNTRKQNTLNKEEVLFVIKSMLELECKYIIKANEVRRDLKKLQLSTVLDIFHKFDEKKLSYINIKDIRGYLQKQNATVPQYLQLVMKKQFKFQLISFQQFYEFFQKPDKININITQQKPLEELDSKSYKRVQFKFDTIKTPNKKGGISKKQQRTSSKSKKSRNSTPKKFRTMSPKRWQQLTLDHEQNKNRLLKRFHLDTIDKQTKRNFGRYFKLYSVYN